MIHSLLYRLLCTQRAPLLRTNTPSPPSISLHQASVTLLLGRSHPPTHQPTYQPTHLYVDASSHGVGGFHHPPDAPLGSLRPSATFFIPFAANPPQAQCFRELAAVRHALGLPGIRGPTVVHCDNVEVVEAIAGRAKYRSERWGGAVGELHRHARNKGLQVSVEWTSSKHERMRLADGLSRGKDVSAVAPLLVRSAKQKVHGR